MKALRATQPSKLLARARSSSSWLVLATSLALGCGGAPRPRALHATTTTGGAPPVGVPSQAFDGLFEAGRQWRFEVEVRTDGEGDDQPHDTVVCRVTEARRFPGGRASEVECDDPGHVPDEVAGVWLQDADGLWRALELPADGVLPDRSAASLLLPARLVLDATGRAVVPDREAEAQGLDVSTEARTDGHGWCVSTSFGGGDTTWSEICLDGDGLVSALSGSGSEETRELRLDRVDE